MQVDPATRRSKQGLLLAVTAILLSASAAFAPAQEKAPANNSKPKTLKVVQRVEHLEKLAREPMVVELSGGTTRTSSRVVTESWPRRGTQACAITFEPM